MTNIQLMQSWNDIARCYPVFAQLEEDVSFSSFMALMDRNYAVGYRLAAATIADHVYGIARFKIVDRVVVGKYLHVDILTTDTRFRSQDVGHNLLLWLADYARSNNCIDVRLAQVS